jgi:hypothetical protein
MVGADHFTQVLRVKPRGHCRGANEIAKHHSELAALGDIDPRWWTSGWRNCSRGLPQGLSATAAELGAGLVIETTGETTRG